MTNTIAEYWKTLEVKLPADISTEQLLATKSAFYAGASAMMSILHDMIDADPSDEMFFKLMQGVERELLDFAESRIKEARARKNLN